MHHRPFDTRRCGSPRRDVWANRVVMVAASWLMILVGAFGRIEAAEEDAAKSAAVSADLDRELRQQVRPLIERF